MRSLVLLLGAAACAFAAVGCGGGSSKGAATPSSTVAEPVQMTIPAREQAPAIAGTSVEGEPISLADYRGGAVLINVWSSW